MKREVKANLNILAKNYIETDLYDYSITHDSRLFKSKKQK